MRPVVIEMRKGKPVVVSCPKKVEVVFREPKKKSLRKQIRTLTFHIRKWFS